MLFLLEVTLTTQVLLNYAVLQNAPIRYRMSYIPRRISALVSQNKYRLADKLPDTKSSLRNKTPAAGLPCSSFLLASPIFLTTTAQYLLLQAIQPINFYSLKIHRSDRMSVYRTKRGSYWRKNANKKLLKCIAESERILNIQMWCKSKAEDT